MECDGQTPVVETFADVPPAEPLSVAYPGYVAKAVIFPRLDRSDANTVGDEGGGMVGGLDAKPEASNPPASAYNTAALQLYPNNDADQEVVLKEGIEMDDAAERGVEVTTGAGVDVGEDVGEDAGAHWGGGLPTHGSGAAGGGGSAGSSFSRSNASNATASVGNTTIVKDDGAYDGVMFAARPPPHKPNGEGKPAKRLQTAAAVPAMFGALGFALVVLVVLVVLLMSPDEVERVPDDYLLTVGDENRLMPNICIDDDDISVEKKRLLKLNEPIARYT